ncbi:hypothetical protein PENDEC_c014G00575 [Penicillium decumbens]|uniref:Uncharacterized protein n=1 Tax=Penicillium decumbens TaxID=69771 RepID=A0A1V6PAE3_PENDC|nr:hypothetical protein PENDEC_c014G00575 [Penicillium decumbens]
MDHLSSPQTLQHVSYVLEAKHKDYCSDSDDEQEHSEPEDEEELDKEAERSLPQELSGGG